MVILGNASRGRIIARDLLAMPSGFARLWAIRRNWPLVNKAIRVEGPAFWAAFAPGPIDVVFMDASMRVVAVEAKLAPWRTAGPADRANALLLLEQGTIDRALIRVGDMLEVAPHTSERIAAGAVPPDFH